MAIIIVALSHSGLTQNICACETLFLLTNTYGGQVGENLLQKTLTNRNSACCHKEMSYCNIYCSANYTVIQKRFIENFHWFCNIWNDFAS